jgi:hypothetical protein
VQNDRLLGGGSCISGMNCVAVFIIQKQVPVSNRSLPKEKNSGSLGFCYKQLLLHHILFMDCNIKECLILTYRH